MLNLMCFNFKFELKVLKFEFAVEVIIIFVKNIKKGIKWCVHFIGKSVI